MSFYPGGIDGGILGYLKDSNGTFTSNFTATFAIALTDTAADVAANGLTALLAVIAGYGVTPDSVEWVLGTASPAPSFANPGRSLNSAYQISASRNALVSYSVDIAATLSLTTGQTGTVYLEYADDSGFTTNVKEVCRNVNGNSGTLAIGLGLTQNGTATLSGMIPAGKYVRLRTQNNTGTPTFTYRSSQEVLV